MDYTVRIPVELTGKNELSTLLAGIKGNESALKQLSGTMKDFAKDVRDGLNEGSSLNKVLGDMRKESNGASEGMRALAGRLQMYVTETRQAEAATNRLQQAMGKIGGRLGGMSTGLPGGGFIGGQLISSLGLSGGVAAGIGGGLMGLFAAFEITKQIGELAKWEEEQRKSAASTNLNLQQMEQLSRVYEHTGVDVVSAAKDMSKWTEEMSKGGQKSAELTSALADISKFSGISVNPGSSMKDMLDALSKIPNMSLRAAEASRLFGDTLGNEIAHGAEEASKGMGKFGALFSDAENAKLHQYTQTMNDLSDAWKQLVVGAAKPVTFTMNMVKSVIDFFGPDTSIPGLGHPFRKGPTPTEQADMDAEHGFLPPRPRVPGVPTEAQLRGINGLVLPQPNRPTADLEAAALASSGDISLKYKGIFDKLNANATSLRTQHDTGALSDKEFSAQIGANAREIARQQEAQKREEEARAQRRNLPKDLRSLQEAGQLKDENPVEAFRTRINKEFGSDRNQFITQKQRDAAINEGVAGMQQRALEAFDESMGLKKSNPADEPFTKLSDLVSKGLVDKNSPQYMGALTSAQVASDRIRAKQEEELGRSATEFTNKQDEEYKKAAQEQIRGITSAAGVQQQQLKLRQAQQEGPLGILRAQGLMSSSDLAGLQYKNTVQSNNDQTAVKVSQYNAEAAAYEDAASKMTDLSKAAEETSEAQKAHAQATEAQTEGLIQNQDALNKFNEAVVSSASKIRDSVSSAFESVVMGAQNRGAKGAQAALKSAAEGQESIMLKNLANYVMSPKGSPLDLTKGTWFDKDSPLMNSQTKLTTATDNLSSNIVNLTNKIGTPGTGTTTTSGAGGLIPAGTTNPGSTSSPDPNSFVPGTTVTYGQLTSSVATASSVGATAELVAGGGSIAGMMAGVQKAFGSFSGALGGGANILTSHDAMAILTGQGPTQSVGMYGDTITPDYSASERVAAGVGLAGMGLGAAEGIMTAAKGGAKNVTGGLGAAAAGIGGILSALSPALAAAGPIGAAVGGVLSLASAFMPNLQQARANQIQKTLFTSQYLASPAENLTEGGNGGYAYTDIHGNVQSTDMSPYPVISNPYLDVPRRTLVPGHTESSFGGFQNVTGAKTPQNPTINNINVTTMDSQSFVDNADKVGAALVAHLQSGNATTTTRALKSHLGLN